MTTPNALYRMHDNQVAPPGATYWVETESGILTREHQLGWMRTGGDLRTTHNSRAIWLDCEPRNPCPAPQAGIIYNVAFGGVSMGGYLPWAVVSVNEHFIIYPFLYTQPDPDDQDQEFWAWQARSMAISDVLDWSSEPNEGEAWDPATIYSFAHNEGGDHDDRKTYPGWIGEK